MMILNTNVLRHSFMHQFTYFKSFDTVAYAYAYVW